MSKILSQMPNRYLAKILQMDHSIISRYKLAASTVGYIFSKHGYEDLQLQLKFIDPLKKSLPEEAHIFVAHKNSIHCQFLDEISSAIHIKHKRLHPSMAIAKDGFSHHYSTVISRMK